MLVKSDRAIYLLKCFLFTGIFFCVSCSTSINSNEVRTIETSYENSKILNPEPTKPPKSITPSISSKKTLPKLIDFFDDSWLICKASLPGIATLKKRVGVNAEFITYEVMNPDSRKSMESYQIISIPTFIVLDIDGKEVWRQTGGVFKSNEALNALFECYSEDNGSINPCW